LYVYKRTESGVYTVGHYEPESYWDRTTGIPYTQYNFISESDHKSSEDAAARVHYLNGGDKRF
jgi:hypothetical protein